MCYSVLHELNTLDAGRSQSMCGVIVVDAARSRSTWYERDAYIHAHSLDIFITLLFSINCSVVICSPTVIFSILREATSETYGPQVFFPLYIGSLLHHTSFRSTILQSLLSIYIIKIPKIFILLLLSLSDLTFVSDLEGIDNPFITLVARFLIVCAGTRWFERCLLLDWYLGSQNWGKYLRYFAASPFPVQGKTNAVLKR